MANNFRIANANKYIAKSGKAGAAGTLDDPLAGVVEFMAGADGWAVVGTGTYRYATDFSYNNYGANNQNLIADGYVKLLGDAQTRFGKLVNAGSTFTGLIFEQFAGFNFRAYYYSNPVYYNQCIFKVLPEFASAPNSNVSGNVPFEDCIFVNVSWAAGAGEMSFNRCLFFNCTSVDQIGSLTNCYLDSTCARHVATATNNNVDPACDVAAGFGLNANGAGFSHSSDGGISAAPGFNNLALDDYSLQANSPHQDRGIGPAQWRQGHSFVAQYAATAGEAVSGTNTRFVAVADAPAVALAEVTGVLDATAQGGLIIRASESPDGMAHLRTGRVLHAEGIPFEISCLTALGGYNFNTSYPALESQFNASMPEVYNNNVFALRQYDAGDAGRNPARLTYGLRWSRLPNPRPDHTEDWVTGDTFVECEWNTRPLYNPTTLVGNGRPEFVVAQGEPIVCTWYQLQIGLSNLYYH